MYDVTSALEMLRYTFPPLSLHILGVLTAMKKISLILLLGITISFAAFTAVKQWEAKQHQQQYQHRANAHTAGRMAGFQSIAKQLEDMRYLLEYDMIDEKESPKDPHEFLDMFTPTLTHEPALVDVDWAVLDPNTEQAHIIYSLKHQKNIERNPDRKSVV